MMWHIKCRYRSCT